MSTLCGNRRPESHQNPRPNKPAGATANPVRPLLEVSVTGITNAVVEQIGMASTNTSEVPFIRWRTG